MSENKALFTVKDAAAYMSVSIRTMREWVNQGKIPYIPIGTQDYRIAKEDLDKFISERRQVRQPKKPKREDEGE